MKIGTREYIIVLDLAVVYCTIMTSKYDIPNKINTVKKVSKSNLSKHHCEEKLEGENLFLARGLVGDRQCLDVWVFA